MKLTLDNKTWGYARTHWADGPRLYEPDTGRYCCIGLYLKACGVTDEQMANAGSAGSPSMRGEIPKQACWLVEEPPVCTVLNSEDASEAMNVNDDVLLTPEQKVDQLRLIFARHGVDLEYLP